MKKIEKMTPEQANQMIAFREDWRKAGLATGQADLDAIRPVITDFYNRIGKPAPVLWRCESPLTAQLVINLGANLGANLGDNLGANLRANLRANLGANLGANLWANLGDNLGANLWANLWANLGDNLGDNLRANLGDNLWDNLGANLGANLWANLGDNLRANLGANLGANLDFYSTPLWGSLDSYWIAFYQFPHTHLRPMHTDDQLQLLAGWEALARNCFWWYPFEGICFVCDRPDFIGMDDEWRMHNPTGPAVSFSDGWKLYAVHGVMLPDWVIERPQEITVEKINTEPNAEVRRVMMERFGYERYIVETGAALIHQDETGRLYRAEVPGDEPLVMVRVINSTPEPDGTRREYWLRVPPAIRTSREAVAWTFDLPAKAYQPIFET